MKFSKELGILKARLPEDAQNELRVWGVLLYANLRAEKELGLSQKVRHERKKILAHLNAISKKHLGVKWDALPIRQPSMPLYPWMGTKIRRRYFRRRAESRDAEYRFYGDRKFNPLPQESDRKIEDWLKSSTERLQREGIIRADDLRGEYPATFRILLRDAPPAHPGQHAKPPDRPKPTPPPAFDIPAFDLPGSEPVPPPPPETAPGAPRYTNVRFVDALDAMRVVAAESSLAANKDYLLRVNIGDKLADSIVSNAAKYPFPAQNLPPSEDGWWLDVRADSRQFTVNSGAARMFLPKSGASWVCDCPPDQPHTCDAATRQPYLDLPVTTPAEARSARLDLCIYDHNNLVQALLVTAAVTPAEEKGAGHHAVIQFSLDARLESLNLPARDLNILTTRATRGTRSVRRVIINGAEADIVLDLNDDQVRVTLEDARQALRDAHYEEWKSAGSNAINRRNKYDPETLTKSRAEFIEDLARLANVGQALWGLLLQSYPAETWKLLEQPRSIQVCRINNSSFLFPWAMIYDIPLDPGAQPKLCPLLEETAWEAFAASLKDSSPRACPHAAEHYQPGGGNTLCPFGFWGFKHHIESPPSVPKGGSLKTAIVAGNQPPQIVVGRSTQLDDRQSQKHLQFLQGLDLAVKDCASLASVRDALKAQVELVYFLCHGKWTKDARRKPYLEVGSADAILPEHILYWRREDWDSRHWATTAPLVMINGCHTLEITPESLLNFVDGFTNARAAGVIGTEITIVQEIASEAAQLFLGAFRAGSSVGEALQRMRLNLLARNNLMGLNYTAYCSTDLALRTSAV